MNVEALKLDIS